jgi:hypothetical protein
VGTGSSPESAISPIDRHLPTYDVRSAHEIEVRAPAAEVYEAARHLDLGKSLPVMVLFAFRAVPHLLTGKARPSRAVTLDTVLELGFVVLEEEPPSHIVIGSIGKFWRPDSGILRLGREEFQTFDEPGFAKGVMSFSVEERGSDGSLLATETRVYCTDDSARRKFSIYWRAIGPFSGFIRHAMLGQIKRVAEEGRAP